MPMMAGAGEAPGPPAAEPRIVTVVIAAADEARLGKVLESVEWTAARIVVGLGAVGEGTPRACESYGVRNVDFAELPGAMARFGAHWVLLIEGHEIVPRGLMNEIRATLTDTAPRGDRAAYRIGRQIRFLGAELRSRVWAEVDRVRLARSDAISWQASSPVSLAVRGPVGILATALLAEPYESLRHYMVRMDIMTREMARVQNGRGRPARAVDLVLPPLSYVLRTVPAAVVRDGLRGVLLAFIEAYALVVTCAKRWELDQISRSPAPAP